MKTVLLLVTLLLAGCGTLGQPKPVTIFVPCEPEPVEKPKTPLQDAQKSEPVEVKLKKALAEIEFRKAYEIELEAAIKSCK